MKEIDFLIIANLMAGKGFASRILENLEDFLRSSGKTFYVLVIDKPAPISLLPNRHRIKEGLICIGGDGTVSESVSYILNHNLEIPLAVIPTGTANFIAKAFGLENHYSDFSFLLNGGLKKVDIGVADYGNERDYFLLGFGLGFEEKFLKIAKEKFKSRMKIFSYIFAALVELLSLKRIPIKIMANGESFSTDVCTLMVLNMPPKILKYFPLFKKKRFTADDGFLDLFYVEYKNYLQSVFGTLFLHLFGRFSLGAVKAFSAKEFYLDSNCKVDTQLDGELKKSLPVKLSLLPKLFKFLV